ncbi:MAG: hypothetical protein JWP92_867 [Caulobacter sp.]|nr:hypothetical protein [Caulobacter sp.]
MATIAANKLRIIRTLVDAAPDGVLRNLELALASAGTLAGPMLAVRDLVEAETADRFIRNNVLAPLVPLFARRGGPQSSFPPRALALLWAALKAEAPTRVEEAAAKCNPWDLDLGAPEVFDELCRLAVTGLRGGKPGFAALAAACDGEGLAACLELTPVVRGALPRLAEWVSRMTQERGSAARLVYRDACAITEDAGPRLFEMLAAHLADDWRILRVISAVMERPDDRYLASSEFSPFGERVLDAIEAGIAVITKFDVEDGEAAGRLAAQSAQHVAELVAEFEQTIELSRNGPWARRMVRYKQEVAQICEWRLAAIEKDLDAALPLEPAPRLSIKPARLAPRLTLPPNERMVRRAAGGLAFMADVRLSAGVSGYGATRSKVVDKVNARLDAYIEDLMYVARTSEGEDRALAQGFLDIAAGFIAYSRDDQTAELVRRRAAALLAA